VWHGKDATSIQPPKKRPSIDSITLTQQQRKDLIRVIKRETKPSRRLRMHIALIASEGFSATQISLVLCCSRTTVDQNRRMSKGYERLCASGEALV
jgi:Homeodomain-like domain